MSGIRHYFSRVLFSFGSSCFSNLRPRKKIQKNFAEGRKKKVPVQMSG
jgi:hypothetical protein